MAFFLTAPYRASEGVQSALFDPDDPFNDIIGVYFGSDDEVVEERPSTLRASSSRGRLCKAGRQGQQGPRYNHSHNTRCMFVDH